MAIRVRYTSRGEKRYQTRVNVGLDDDGKRIELTRTFRLKKDAQRWQAEQQVALGKGVYAKPSEEPFGKYLRQWLDGPKRQQVRERTWQNYDRALTRYVMSATIARVPLVSLTTARLEAFYADLASRGAPSERCGPLGEKSIRNVHAILFEALRIAVRDNLILANPASGAMLPKDQQRVRNQLPEEASRRMRVLSATDVDRLLEVSGRPPPPKSGIRSGRHARRWSWQSPRTRNRWHALWHVLVNGGLRPGEALALTWKDVDWEHGAVQVKKSLVTGLKGRGWIVTAPKTEKSIRTVPLPTETMAALGEHHLQQQGEREAAGNRYQDHGLVFAGELGAPVDLKNATRRHFRDLLKAADLPPIRVYDLRHTHASLILSAGVPVHVVSARLGHASAKMTLDVYSHALEHQQRDAVEAYQNYLEAEVAKS